MSRAGDDPAVGAGDLRRRRSPCGECQAHPARMPDKPRVLLDQQRSRQRRARRASPARRARASRLCGPAAAPAGRVPGRSTSRRRCRRPGRRRSSPPTGRSSGSWKANRPALAAYEAVQSSEPPALRRAGRAPATPSGAAAGVPVKLGERGDRAGARVDHPAGQAAPAGRLRLHGADHDPAVGQRAAAQRLVGLRARRPAARPASPSAGAPPPGGCCPRRTVRDRRVPPVTGTVTSPPAAGTRTPDVDGYEDPGAAREPPIPGGDRGEVDAEPRERRACGRRPRRGRVRPAPAPAPARSAARPSGHLPEHLRARSPGRHRSG